MKKRHHHHHSYIVTFCSRSGSSGGSSTSICSVGEQSFSLPRTGGGGEGIVAGGLSGGGARDNEGVVIMERKQDSSTDLLIVEDGSGVRGGRGAQAGSSDSVKSMERLRDKFRGCLLGALVGDCVGTLFERDYSVSYALLEDLYKSLTNLSEDEKLMDLHGIDLTLGAKRIKEILDTKRQSCAMGVVMMGGEEEEEEEGGVQSRLLKPPSIQSSQQMRRNSALACGTPGKITGLTGSSGGSRRGSFSRPMERYSDDTVMTKSVLHSLLACKGFDGRDMARQLTEDYFLNMNRKFGGYIRDIFVQLRENGYQDPYNPAKKCSGGIGAQGNEAASRVSPIALYCCGPQDTQQVLVEMAGKGAKITNGHRGSVNGTVLQALAVHTAFNWEFSQGAGGEKRCSACGTAMGGEGGGATSASAGNSRHGSPLLMRRRGSLHHTPVRNSLIVELGPPGGGGGGVRIGVEQQPKYFCEQVLERMSLVEGRGSSLFENLKHLVHTSVGSSAGMKDIMKPVEPTYCDKLRTILEFLQRSQPPARIEIVERLGNGAKAIDSVPTALYSFLFSAKNDTLPEIGTPIKSPVLRTIFHAISLGGETDTLASMAGAIAGAYWGFSHIPPEILRVCEGASEIVKLADELFNLLVKKKLGASRGSGGGGGGNGAVICQSCQQSLK